MNRHTPRRAACFAVILLILAAASAVGLGLRSSILEIRQREAENVLFYYREKILLQMGGTMNEAGSLAQTAYVMEKEQPGSLDWFDHAAEPLLEREEVRFAYLFAGDTMVSLSLIHI